MITKQELIEKLNSHRVMTAKHDLSERELGIKLGLWYAIDLAKQLPEPQPQEPCKNCPPLDIRISMFTDYGGCTITPSYCPCCGRELNSEVKE